MPRLPDNVERLRDGRGYRYRAFNADGWCYRLTRDPSSGYWHGYQVSTGGYAGSGRTLAEVARKVSAHIR